jgi:hypothetical protein
MRRSHAVLDRPVKPGDDSELLFGFLSIRLASVSIAIKRRLRHLVKRRPAGKRPLHRQLDEEEREVARDVGARVAVKPLASPRKERGEVKAINYQT